ncbi:MAG: HAMP domain-containing histidine kinase [Saprospiraceae bacterium]|nr:HAMP domain-containing histidine kinase [Saprospiraceae bacterium]
MDLYTRKSHWKWYLAAGAILIIIVSMIYTKYLADQLTVREEQQAKLWAEAQRALNKVELDTFQFFHCDLTMPVKVLELNNTIPVILVNNSGQIEDALNVPGSEGKTIDTVRVRQELNRMFREGIDSVDASIPPDIYKKVYFSRSKLLGQLWWYPLVQLGLIAAFIAFGYIGFSTARRSEQNQVWLGMAKETAHQLGTPITAILGWIETLKAVNEERPDNQEMLDELRNDVTRLELVADRFSKIGATPELRTVNLYEELEFCRAYMQRRSPRKVEFAFPDPNENQPLMVDLNTPLFDWVIENLLRNAIDAMEGGVGKLSAIVYEEGRYACVEVSDTGKGIPSGKFKTIFKPGYSTKTRGWGLGLSLAKRIIEEYHGGKIFVKKSEIGKGTTFLVKVPKTR